MTLVLRLRDIAVTIAIAITSRTASAIVRRRSDEALEATRSIDDGRRSAANDVRVLAVVSTRRLDATGRESVVRHPLRMTVTLGLIPHTEAAVLGIVVGVTYVALERPVGHAGLRADLLIEVGAWARLRWRVVALVEVGSVVVAAMSEG